MVFYRKYRPQKISELDSEEIRSKLYTAFSDLSNTAHAFLFTGPKGLGKTSAARIVAKVVNCEKSSKLKAQSSKRKTQNLKNESNDQGQKTNDQIEPCNECDQCKSITNGTNLDILEIDGASNRGIDEIRELREKIKLAPVSANKKVYIIDEVHMLTTEAFNALLKTLEEPPSHVIFILCTTEPHKVPETIVSRCFHIPFKLATKEELISSFKRIIDRENLDLENDALSYIAELSDGSFRDGVKILDELTAISVSSKTKISKELVESKYQISNIKYQISKLLEYLEKKDMKKSLKLISELVEQGVDMKFFIEKLVGELHSMLLRKVGVGSSVGDSSSLASELARLPADSNIHLSRSSKSPPSFSIINLKTLIELFSKASGELKYAVLPSLPLELAVIEWGQKEEESTRGPVKSFPPASARLSHPAKPDERLRAVGSPPTFATPRSSKSPPSQDNIWQELINKVKTHNHSLAGILRGCSLKNFNGKSLEIETAYKFHKEKLSENKAGEVLSNVIKDIVGKDIEVKVLLKEK